MKPLLGEPEKYDFYERYFDNDDYIVYRYDVGSFCTRRFIIKHITHSTGNLLEIGVGISTLLEDLQNFTCFGVDISSTTIAKVQHVFETKKIKAELAVASATALPFEDNFFDVIVSAHTFEHIEHDDLAIKECFRVLKPGGELILFVPGRVNGRATTDEWLRLGHYRK